jgi:uncharacterized protein (DUF362 family)
MRKLSRRRFLETSLAAAAGLAGWRALAAPPDDLVDVSGSDPKAMVAAALAALGGIGRLVRPGDYVVLKPNAGFANPASWATTTSPDVVLAVAKACLEARAKQVTVVEFPVSKGAKCLERCGLNAALASLPDVKVKVLNGPADFQKVSVPGAVALKSVEVAKLALSADVLISIPVAKAHGQAGVSFGLKNAMGLVLDRAAFHQMLDLHQAIADLGRAVKPTLTLLDATRALLTNGPAGPGEIATPGRIVAGRAAASVDAYGLTLARFNQRQLTPADVRHIALAGRAGLGETDVAKLRVRKVTA